MRDWHQSDEFEMPLWVLDLDDALYSVDHRRLCAWPDEFDGRWHWEIQTNDGDGVAGSGICATLAQAQEAALALARQLAGTARAD